MKQLKKVTTLKWSQRFLRTLHLEAALKMFSHQKIYCIYIPDRCSV